MAAGMLQRPPQIGKTWMWSRRRTTCLKQMMLMNLTYKGNFSVSFSEDAAYSVQQLSKYGLIILNYIYVSNVSMWKYVEFDFHC
ncbi:hypothetical protein HN51_059040, partial [Arachis hypogaea]